MNFSKSISVHRCKTVNATSVYEKHMKLDSKLLVPPLHRPIDPVPPQELGLELMNSNSPKTISLLGIGSIILESKKPFSTKIYSIIKESIVLEGKSSDHFNQNASENE